MSYSLYDIGGWVGDIATSKGLADLTERMKKEKTVSSLFHFGWTSEPEKIAHALSKITVRKRDVKLTVDNLIDLLNKCKEVAVISDGLNDNL